MSLKNRFTHPVVFDDVADDNPGLLRLDEDGEVAAQHVVGNARPSLVGP